MEVKRRTPAEALARQEANKLGEMLWAEKHWKSISKTPEEYNIHLKNHAYNLKEKARLMSGISEDEMKRVIREYGIDEGASNVAKRVKKVNPELEATRNSVGYTDPSKVGKAIGKQPRGTVVHTAGSTPLNTPDYSYKGLGKTEIPIKHIKSPILASGYRRGVSTAPRRPTVFRIENGIRSPVAKFEQGLVGTTKTSRFVKSYGTKIAKTSAKAMPIVSKLAPLGRAVGGALAVVSAAGDLERIRQMNMEIGRSVRHKGVVADVGGVQERRASKTVSKPVAESTPSKQKAYYGVQAPPPKKAPTTSIKATTTQPATTNRKVRTSALRAKSSALPAPTGLTFLNLTERKPTKRMHLSAMPKERLPIPQMLWKPKRSAL
jgi:hypothetical protein